MAPMTRAPATHDIADALTALYYAQRATRRTFCRVDFNGESQRDTKPMKATINGNLIQNPNWASILHAMIAQVKAKGFEGEKLVRELCIPSSAT